MSNTTPLYRNELQAVLALIDAATPTPAIERAKVKLLAQLARRSPKEPRDER